MWWSIGLNLPMDRFAVVAIVQQVLVDPTVAVAGVLTTFWMDLCRIEWVLGVLIELCFAKGTTISVNHWSSYLMM
jgi:hypothetical protein